MRKTTIFLAFGLMLAAMPALAAAPDLNVGLEAKVRAAFADAPDMIVIAKCESGFRQFAPDGSILRGGPKGRYVGLFQIDEILHTAQAAALGDDILTAEGNIAYARHLLSVSGEGPWGCAPVKTAASAPAAAEGALVHDLRLGMLGPEIMTLQRLLNASGIAVAAEGPGSPGHETERFGALTLEAVKRFQCAKDIVCQGGISTTGYGRVGPRTRAALNLISP